jgi:hypothetical protein
MTRLTDRRHALRVLASTAFTMGTLGAVDLARAAGPEPHPQPVPVPMSLATGFALPSTLPAGWVALEVTTPDTSGGLFLHYLQGFRPRAGVTPEQVVEDLRLALGSDAAGRAEGMRALLRDAELLGGAAPEAGTAVVVWLPLTAGPAWFVDLNDFFVPGQVVNLQRVDVIGSFAGRPPIATAHASMTMAGGVPRFVARSAVPETATLMVTNRSHEAHELVLQRLLPGATDADIQRYFEGAGESPFAESKVRGLAAISPGRTAFLRIDRLPPGTYAMQCFAADIETGVPHTVGGMHRVIEWAAASRAGA